MSTRLYSPADVAEAIGKSADYWTRQARAKKVDHVRLGASIRFTAEQIGAIIRANTVTAEPSGRTPALADVTQLPTGVDAMAAALVTRRKAVAR